MAQAGYDGCIGTDARKQLALLTMLHAIATEAIRAFEIADNPVDEDLLADLEKMAARTHVEIEVLAAKLAGVGTPPDS